MHLIPIQISPTAYDLVVVLDPEAITRLQKYDPGEVPVNNLPEPWSGLKLNLVRIAFCTPEELNGLRGKSARDIWNFLSKGWEYHPELGDDDDGPKVIQ